MVFLHTRNTLGDLDETGFQLPDGVKRTPIGAKGVVVSQMVLDPLADLEPGPNSANPLDTATNLLYMACGRDGLWVMEADVTAGNGNKAWRVDDSGNGLLPEQGSRRWCSDVDFMTVGGKDYLLALFTKKGHSALRAYELNDVRTLAHPFYGNDETGDELQNDLQVILGGNPNAPASTSPVSFSRSIAVAMAVDQGDDEADVYVAMGPHGIVKVSYPPDAFPTGASVTKTWGPVFGEGSDYDSGAPGITTKPQGQASGLYGDFVLETNHAFRSQQVSARLVPSPDCRQLPWRGVPDNAIPPAFLPAR